MKPIVAFLLSTALFAVGASAQTNIIDFESLSTPGTGFGYAGQTYREKGFLFAPLLWGPGQFSFYRTNDSRSPGSTALYMNNQDNYTCLTRMDGGAFDFLSIDLCSLSLQLGSTIDFIGYYGSRALITNTVITTGGFILHTFPFSGFTNVTEVRWQQQTPDHQFDNVVLFSRPDPPPPTALQIPIVDPGLATRLQLSVEHLRVTTNYTLMKSTNLVQWQTLRSFQAQSPTYNGSDTYNPTNRVNMFYLLLQGP